MIDTEDLEKIFALTFYSAYVANEKPVSLIVLSDRPEAGKTEVAKKFYGNNGIRFLSDATAYALWRDFHSDIEKGNIKHIIIPEFLAPLSRKSETVNSLISTLQMLIEDGMMEVHTGFLKPIICQSPITIGVVACMPRIQFEARKKEWMNSGFLSRFMMASYKHNDNTIDRIFKSIEKREYFKEAKIKLVFPDKAYDIKIPSDLAHSARVMVEEQTAESRKQGRTYGYRELKNILRLICANVVMKNMQDGKQRTSASKSDLEEVKNLSYLMNDSFNTLKEMVKEENKDADSKL